MPALLFSGFDLLKMSLFCFDSFWKELVCFFHSSARKPEKSVISATLMDSENLLPSLKADNFSFHLDSSYLIQVQRQTPGSHRLTCPGQHSSLPIPCLAAAGGEGSTVGSQLCP